VSVVSAGPKLEVGVYCCR